MPLDQLARDFLTRLNAAVKRKVTVVLIGGNALTFLGFKGATGDVDIVCRSTEPEVAKFCQEYRIKYKVKVEFFVDGLFKTMRVKDYLVHAYPYEQIEFPNIDLKILNIYDLILTKISRSLPRDLEDIGEVLRRTEISQRELDVRFAYLLKFTMGPSNKEDFTQKYETVKQMYANLFKP